MMIARLLRSALYFPIGLEVIPDLLNGVGIKRMRNRLVCILY